MIDRGRLGMTDIVEDQGPPKQHGGIADVVNKGRAARYAKEKRFRIMGISAIVLALLFLLLLFSNIIWKGHTAFVQTMITLDVEISEDLVDRNNIAAGDFRMMAFNALFKLFPEVEGRRNKRALTNLISSGAGYQIADYVKDDPDSIGTVVQLEIPASDDVDMLNKGNVNVDAPESDRRVSNMEIAWFNTLVSQNRVEKVFNTQMLSSGDSREPELAGIWAAVVGSFWTMVITLSLSFPIGVMAALYLEEFAPKNRWTDLIEVNINNLAAVPSIVFGLLGLAVFLNFFGLPRSAPLVGGLVLTLMTLPTIIIASRAALKSVPPSIREAALGMGASRLQAMTHHVLPLALPGMMTGTIIGLAQALGETAPLLMIGMVAFVVDIPGGPTDPATVLPVQIYLWADAPERAFVERTSAAIMVLLAFLISMNLIAIVLRKRFERRW